MNTFKKKTLALAVSLALAMVCFAAVTAVSFADEGSAFTCDVYVYDTADEAAAAAAALEKGDPAPQGSAKITEQYTDQTFKAIGGEFDPTYVKYLGNWGKKWHVINVKAGTSLKQIAEDQGIPKAGLTKIYLAAPDKNGNLGIYTKFSYEQIYDQTGAFLPKSSAVAGAVLEGAYEVPNGVLATEYVRNDLENSDETLFGDVNGQTAAGGYYMMVAPDMEGNVANPDGSKTPIAEAGGKPFCSDVSGATFIVVKQAQKLKATGKTVKVKVKAKKTTFKASKVFKVSGAESKVTYKRISGNKKISVASNGKVTVKKGLKKGKTYTVKVQVSAEDNSFYGAATAKTSFKVKVK